MDSFFTANPVVEKSPVEAKRPRHDSKSHSRRRDRHRSRRSKSHHSSSAKESPSPNKKVTESIEGIVLDNGGYSIKVHYSHAEQPRVIPNCIMKAKSERKRLFIGNQIDECRDCSGLFYLIPNERGYTTKWDVQKPVWDYVFSKTICPVNNHPIVMTQPIFNFKSIQDCIDEIFFEDYEVSALFRSNPTDLALVKYHDEIGAKPPCVILDAGYSFTHVVPYLEGKKYLEATKRVHVGGKLLTNHLKDIISYRQYHVMEETFVINQVKEDTCYVSQDFKGDLRISSLSGGRNSIVKNYVLPDFNNIRRGYVQDPEQRDELAENCQILRLNNERFTVPEIMFHPSDIGIKSIGIAEAIYKSIMTCPKYYQRDLAKNVVLIGGSTKFAGFKDRIYSELRSMIPASWDVNVYQPDDPVSYSWMGGKVLLNSSGFKSQLVTKQQYEELGSSAIQERFNTWADEVHEDKPPRAEKETISYIDHIKKYNVFGKGPSEEDLNVETVSNENSGSEQGVKESESGENKEKMEEVKSEVDAASKTGSKSKKVTRTNSVLYSVKVLSSSKANSGS